MINKIKIIAFALTLNLSLISSCGNDPKFQFPLDAFKIDKVYDIGNANDASDVRIHIAVSKDVSISNINEIRTVVVKNGKKITEADVSTIKAGNYFSITPTGDDKNQVIKPSSSTKDFDGSPIINETTYQLYAIVIGKDDAISITSPKEFKLLNRPIYAGNYLGSWRDLGPPGPANTPTTLRINDDYTGQMFFSDDFQSFGFNAQDEIVEMSVNGNVISSFKLQQNIGGYSGNPPKAGLSGCPASGVLTGNFEDDINLKLNQFSWSDCDGTRGVILTFTKI
jgi:hypothetical protein